MPATEMTAWIARASILLIAGYLIARFVESRSASMAHRVLVVCLLGAAILPLLSRGLPHWEWAKPTWISTALLENEAAIVVTPERDSSVRDQAELRLSDDLMATVLGDLDAGEALSAGSAEERDARVLPQKNTTAASTPVVGKSAVKPTTAGTGWMRIFAMLWVAGAILLAVRLICCVLVLWKFAQACHRATEELSQVVDSTARRLVPRRSICVAMSPPDTMPMACWLGRWTIILPWRTRLVISPGGMHGSIFWCRPFLVSYGRIHWLGWHRRISSDFGSGPVTNGCFSGQKLIPRATRKA